MANEKISAMPNASAMADADLVPGVQGGANVKFSGSQIKTYAGGATGATGPAGPAGATGATGATGPASLTVTDGSTTVASVTELSFSGATVSNGGAGVADVAISGGGLTVNPAVTPTVGGGQSGAAQLSGGVTFVNAPASQGDSLQLPPASAGTAVTLIPQSVEGATTLPTVAGVFVKDGTSDTINGTSGGQYDLLFDLTQGLVSGTQNLPAAAWFVCVTDGAWLTNAIAD